ncbi:retrotransposon protein, putative, ty1-copia subclass [Tanacetum coccineum]
MAKLRFRMFKEDNLRVMRLILERVKLWEQGLSILLERQTSTRFFADRLEEIEDCDDLQLQTTSDFKADHMLMHYDSDCDDEAMWILSTENNIILGAFEGWGHCKRNCPAYLTELIKKKKQVGPASSSGNGVRAQVEAIGSDNLVLPSGLVFKNEVENQLGKTIKALRSDRGGEYISQEFKDYLKACGIVQQLTPPYTPQHNGVSERRNRTLLDMVRSMMNLTTLPLSFWDYALESATRITKKVDKTTYELWYEKVPNLSCLKV